MSNRETIARLIAPPHARLAGLVLHQLAQGLTLTRIEAVKLAGAHALPSTISELRHRHGFKEFIPAKPARAPRSDGMFSRMAAYSMPAEPEALSLAFRLLWSWGWFCEGVQPPADQIFTRTENQLPLFADALSASTAPHPVESSTGRGVSHG
jgi:hypothetical protein